MKDIERGWVAGLLEGEGSFMVKRGNYALVQCAMTDQDTLETLQELCGGSLRENAYKAKPHYKTVWTWALQGSAAEQLMEDLKPIMSTRRQSKIQEVLAVAQKHRSSQEAAKGARVLRNQEIGQAYLNGEGTLRALAQRFGVSQVTVKTWADKIRG